MRTAEQIIARIDYGIRLLQKWQETFNVSTAGPVTWHNVNGKLKALMEMREWIVKP